MFPREQYYSQTEIVKRYKVSVKKCKELIQAHNIPVLSKKIDLGGYFVDTIYVPKEAIDKLNLTKRN